jgi:hypothetical protein
VTLDHGERPSATPLDGAGTDDCPPPLVRLVDCSGADDPMRRYSNGWRSSRLMAGGGQKVVEIGLADSPTGVLREA